MPRPLASLLGLANVLSVLDAAPKAASLWATDKCKGKMRATTRNKKKASENNVSIKTGGL